MRQASSQLCNMAVSLGPAGPTSAHLRRCRVRSLRLVSLSSSPATPSAGKHCWQSSLDMLLSLHVKRGTVPQKRMYEAVLLPIVHWHPPTCSLCACNYYSSVSYAPQSDARDVAGALHEPGAHALPRHTGTRLLLVVPWIHMHHVPGDVVAHGCKGATGERQVLSPAQDNEVIVLRSLVADPTRLTIVVASPTVTATSIWSSCCFQQRPSTTVRTGLCMAQTKPSTSLPVQALLKYVCGRAI